MRGEGKINICMQIFLLKSGVRAARHPWWKLNPYSEKNNPLGQILPLIFPFNPFTNRLYRWVLINIQFSLSFFSSVFLNNFSTIWNLVFLPWNCGSSLVHSSSFYLVACWRQLVYKREVRRGTKRILSFDWLKINCSRLFSFDWLKINCSRILSFDWLKINCSSRSFCQLICK